MTLLAAVAPLGAGCTAIFGFPEAASESSIALCSNGVDDDFDGVFDCEDESCDGSCPEAEQQCSDGRDNDGDSPDGVALVDVGDPECWGSPMLAERCAFVPGGRIESWRRTATEAFPGPDWVTSGDVVLFRPYSEFADLIRLFPGEFMESRLPLRGTIDAMGINVAVELRAGAELRISLVSERLGEVVAATLRTPVFRELEAWVEAADGARTPVLEITHPDHGYQVWEYDLVGANGAWHLEGLDDRATERLPFSPTLPLDEPLFVRFESRGEGSAYLRLGQLSAARGSFDTCGRSFASPLINSAALRAAAEGNGTRCVVLAEQAYRSRDGSRWSGSRSPIRAGTVGMAWVPTFERFEGVRLDAEAGGLRFFASDTCDVFRESEPVSVSSLVALSAAQVVGFDFVPGAEGGERRLWLLGSPAADSEQLELVELASATGLPESYQVVARFDWELPTWPTNAPLSVRRVGHEVIVLGPGANPDAIAAHVLRVTEGASALVNTVDPLVEPSGTTGTFDRFRVSHGLIVPQAPALPEGDPTALDMRGLPLRVYYFGELLPGEPGYSSAPVRSGAGWADLVFGGSAP